MRVLHLAFEVDQEAHKQLVNVQTAQPIWVPGKLGLLANA